MSLEPMRAPHQGQMRPAEGFVSSRMGEMGVGAGAISLSGTGMPIRDARVWS